MVSGIKEGMKCMHVHGSSGRGRRGAVEQKVRREVGMDGEGRWEAAGAGVVLSGAGGGGSSGRSRWEWLIMRKSDGGRFIGRKMQCE